MIPWIPFIWSSDTLFGRELKRSAIFLKGKIIPLEKEGSFQFDLGAPRSVIYGKAFEPNSLEKFVTDKTATLNSQEVPVLNLTISVGDLSVTSPALLKDFGEGEIDGSPIVGTVGADLVDGRILIVDFPHQRIAVVDSLPEVFVEKTRFAELTRTPRGHLFVRVEVNGKETLAMYDSGSSIFGLITTREIWEDLTDGEVIDSFKITAWGKVHTVYAGRGKAKITVAGEPIRVDTIHYVDMEGLGDFLRQANAIGIMGNRPMWDRTIVVDTKGGRFGIYLEGR